MKRIAVWIWMVMAAATGSVAAPVTIVADARGCVRDSGAFGCGSSGTGSGNYLTGFLGNETTMPPNEELRSFFRFDLTGLAGTVTTASFAVAMPGGGYRSVHATETFGLFDYLLNPTVLETGPLTAAAFADLGTGTLYGSGLFDVATEGTTVSIPLNEAAVAAINGSLGGKFAMGGAVTTLASQADQKELVFGLSGSGYVTQLVLGFDPAPANGVPEPGSAAFLVIGLGGLAIWGRRSGRV